MTNLEDYPFPLPLQEKDAANLLKEQTDSITRNLMDASFAQARMRFLRYEHLTEPEWRARLPVAPFDMKFFLTVMRDVLTNRQRLLHMMQGGKAEEVPDCHDWLQYPLRQADADRLVEALEDSITKSLVKLCLAYATAYHARWPNMTEAECRARLPVAPFDMAFFVAAITGLFSDREFLLRVMQGESLAAASGWDDLGENESTH